MKIVSYSSIIKILEQTMSKSRLTLSEIDSIYCLKEDSQFPASYVASVLKKKLYLWDSTTCSDEIKGKNILLITDFFHDDEEMLKVKEVMLFHGASGVEFMSIHHIKGKLTNPSYSKEVKTKISYPWS